MRDAQAWLDEQVRSGVHYALALRRAMAVDRSAALDQRILSDKVGPVIEKMLSARDERSRQFGLQKAHLDDLRYAVVALISEFAQVSPGDHRWQDELLRRAGFPIEPIGEQFYRRLDQRLEQFRKKQLSAADDDRRLEQDANLLVLQFYALCIGLGFRGKYGASVGADAEKFQAYLQRVYKAIGSAETGMPPVPRRDAGRSSTWSEPRALTLMLALMALIAASAFVGFRRELGRQSAEVREIVRARGEQVT